MNRPDYTLTANSPQALQPATVTLQLKPHQLASLHRMQELDINCKFTNGNVDILTNMGLYSDIPGYGKTIVALALVASTRDVNMKVMDNTDVFNRAGYGYTHITHVRTNHICTSLLVVPDILVKHWVRHLESYTDLIYEIITDENIHKIEPTEHDLIIVSASVYNNYISHQEVIWNRVIFDEADSIRIPNTRTPKARFVWFITGTLEGLTRRKNRGFITGVFDNIGNIRYTFASLIVSGHPDFVKNSFDIPQAVETVIECRQSFSASIVQSHVKDHVLQMINAGDINAAILALGGSVETDRDLIALVTRNTNNELVMLRGKLAAIGSLDISAEEREERETRIRDKCASLETRLTAIKESVEQIDQADCCICLCKLESPTMVPCCNNIFCGGCIITWNTMSNKCPACRGEYSVTQLKTVGVSSVKKCEERPLKHEALLRLISERPDGKFVVCSFYPDTFKFLGQLLKDAGISVGVLSTVTKVDTNLAKFRNGEISVLLLDARNNGAGIEIPECTDIVLYHSMSESVETQAIARAQRPGRKGVLNVFRLLLPLLKSGK